ncbi:MAG: ArsR family transcriptional regulator, arsenate/arsenite/antimonite-responsive transcriptional [Actinomycetota bacterium]|jgi:ArsR family transcriptional regulator
MAVDMSTDGRTEVLKALAEPARWRIVERLASEELCVCHLVEDLGIPQTLVSHHLKVLRTAGVVESERFKQWIYYRLLPDAVAAVADELGALTRSSRRNGDRRRPCC